MDAEQGESHSERDDDLNASDLEKLAGLMDEEGRLPPHSEGATDEEQQQQQTDDKSKAAPSNKQPEAKATTDKSTPQQGAEQAESAEVEYEGKKYTVPAALKDALLRQSDYTTKTQALSQERTAIHQERHIARQMMTEAQSFVGQYATIQQIDMQLQQLHRVDMAQLEQVDPIKALQAKQSWHDLMAARNTVLAQINSVRQATSQRDAHELRQATVKGHEELTKVIPDWGEEKQKALLELATSEGYRPDELATLTDPRAVRILHRLHVAEEKAAKYDALTAKGPAIQKQVQQAPPKIVKPQARQEQPGAVERSNAHLSRLRKTGSDDDAVAALRELSIG